MYVKNNIIKKAKNILRYLQFYFKIANSKVI